MLHINSHLASGQVADMTHGRCHFIIGTEKFFYGFDFGRGLYNYKILCQTLPPIKNSFMLSGGTSWDLYISRVSPQVPNYTTKKIY